MMRCSVTVNFERRCLSLRSLIVPGMLALVCGGVGWSAHCTTVLNQEALPQYQGYVARAENAMASRFAKGDLAWVPDSARPQAMTDLNAGRQVRRNISDAATNQSLAGLNATVIDWVGAIRIRSAGVQDLIAVLQDYPRYPSIYKPLIYDCRSQPVAGSAPPAYDVIFGIESTYRAAVIPLHYSLEAKTRTEYSSDGRRPGSMLLVHSRAGEIRESDSGVPGRMDFLELYHDHGSLWALNTYWRAHQSGPDLYVEFETITLARSVEEFYCKIGLFRVPRLIISGAMEAIPNESVEVMLAGTKAACERAASHRETKVPRQ
jgi:hypothetical protein